MRDWSTFTFAELETDVLRRIVVGSCFISGPGIPYEEQVMLARVELKCREKEVCEEEVVDADSGNE